MLIRPYKAATAAHGCPHYSGDIDTAVCMRKVLAKLCCDPCSFFFSFELLERVAWRVVGRFLRVVFFASEVFFPCLARSRLMRACLCPVKGSRFTCIRGTRLRLSIWRSSPEKRNRVRRTTTTTTQERST